MTDQDGQASPPARKKAASSRHRPKEVKVSRADVMAEVEAAAEGRRKQKSFYLTEALLERVNGAVYWARASVLEAARRGEDIDMREVPDRAATMLEQGLWAEVLRVERLLNDGEPFPPAPGPLSPGPGAAGTARLRRPRGEGSQ